MKVIIKKFKKYSDHTGSLVPFYKKKSLVKDTTPELNNKRAKTKKNEFSLKNNKHSKSHNSHNSHNNYINNTNLNKIRILKRNETISHTLKNMIGIVGSNPYETNNIVSDIIDDTNNNVCDTGKYGLGQCHHVLD